MCLFRELHAFEGTVFTGNFVVDRFAYVSYIAQEQLVWNDFMKSLVLTYCSWLLLGQRSQKSWTDLKSYISEHP
jgi:hypothetical protein